MLNISGYITSVRVTFFSAPLLMTARSHLWLFHPVHSRDLPFHVACSFLGELMSCLWQRLATF